MKQAARAQQWGSAGASVNNKENVDQIVVHVDSSTVGREVSPRSSSASQRDFPREPLAPLTEQVCDRMFSPHIDIHVLHADMKHQECCAGLQCCVLVYYGVLRTRETRNLACKPQNTDNQEVWPQFVSANNPPIIFERMIRTVGNT